MKMWKVYHNENDNDYDRQPTVELNVKKNNLKSKITQYSPSESQYIMICLCCIVTPLTTSNTHN